MAVTGGWDSGWEAVSYGYKAVQEPKAQEQQRDGPRAHGNTARRVVDDQDAEGSGQQRPKNDPRNNQHPRYANCWAPLTKRHQQEHGLHQPTGRTDPPQRAKARAGDCPGPRKETATRRSVTQRGPPPPPTSSGSLAPAGL